MKYVLGSIFIALVVSTSHAQTFTWMMLTWIIQPSVNQQSSNWTIWDVVYGTDVIDDPEFLEALNWMYEKWLTSFKNPTTYRSFDQATREESAKLLGRFAKFQLWSKTQSSNDCVFNDIEKDWDPTLKQDMIDSCLIWLFKWSQWNYYPKRNIRKSEALAVMIRMFDNKFYDETTNPRYLNYFKRAQELGLTRDKNYLSLDKPVNRYELALLIYRFKTKFQLLQSTTIDRPKDQVITTVSWSTTTWINWLKKWNAYVDVNLLSDPSIDSLWADIFWQKYRLVKRKLDTYSLSRNNFLWLGELFTADTNKYIWTATFTVIDNIVKEAYIRPTELWPIYYTFEYNNQPPYYTLLEMKSR